MSLVALQWASSSGAAVDLASPAAKFHASTLKRQASLRPGELSHRSWCNVSSNRLWSFTALVGLAIHLFAPRPRRRLQRHASNVETVVLDNRQTSHGEDQRSPVHRKCNPLSRHFVRSAPQSSQDTPRNSCFLYLKPHADTADGKAFVKIELRKLGIEIEKEGRLTAEEMRERRIIDHHYGSLASKALNVRPTELVVQPEAQQTFQECFGLSWKSALEQDLVCNSTEAMSRCHWTAEELGELWHPLQMGEGKVKLSGGCYCGRIEGIFVINGFYMAMQSIYTQPGRTVSWYSLKWNAENLSWSEFRKDVLGNTDPAVANKGSLRASFYDLWAKLGLQTQPHVGENAVHASASPFEALSEKMNWLGLQPSEDDFGQKLLNQGIGLETLKLWTMDPIVQLRGRQISLFDAFENMDSEDCLELVNKLEFKSSR